MEDLSTLNSVIYSTAFCLQLPWLRIKKLVVKLMLQWAFKQKAFVNNILASEKFISLIFRMKLVSFSGHQPHIFLLLVLD